MRTTPGPSELFMSCWQQSMFAEGASRPGSNGWNPAKVLHWAKVWVDCCDLAGRLAEMEAKADAEATADAEALAANRYAAGAES